MRSGKLSAGLGFLAVLFAADSALAWYSPATGRFLSRDPIDEPGAILVRQLAGRFIPRDPQDRLGGRELSRHSECLNLYRALVNSPVWNVDALGLEILGLDNPIAPPQPPSGHGVDHDRGCYAAYKQGISWCYGEYGNGFSGENLRSCLRMADDVLRSCVSEHRGNIGCGRPYPLAACGNCNYPTSYRYMNVQANCMCCCMGDDEWSKRVRSCLLCYYQSGMDADTAHAICYLVGDGYTERPLLKLGLCAAKCLFY